MVDAAIREGDVIAGKYEVERVLGVGGMGVVVAARHLELDQRVAVKFLLPEIAERGDAAERFRREARAAVKITSEHVARVIDVGTMSGGIPFMVMEYLSGHDLSNELKERNQLPVRDAADWVLQACEAVAEAHAAGIVHRDLKPSNLFLAKRADGSRVVKVLDFGISKSVAGGSMADMALTKTSALIGSPLYMSPEQMHSAKSVDVRTDIWSLGAILYEALAGRPPYVGESLPQLCASLLNDTQPPLSEFRGDVPSALERAITRALQKDRTQRFQSVAELAQAVAPHASPSVRICAERATRVLGADQTHMSSSDLEPTTSGGTELMSRRPAELSTLASTPDAMVSPTHSSWGKTGEPSSQPRRLARWLVIAGVGLLAAIVLIALGISRTRASAEPAEIVAATVPSAEAPPPSAEPTDPAPSAAPTAAAIDTAVVPPASASAAPVAPAVQRAGKTVRPAAGDAKGSTSTPPSGTIPDFGGRR